MRPNYALMGKSPLPRAFSVGAYFGRTHARLKRWLRKKNSGVVPRAVKMEAYLAEFLWREMVGGPVFPNLCDAVRGNSDHMARYGRRLSLGCNYH